MNVHIACVCCSIVVLLLLLVGHITAFSTVCNMPSFALYCDLLCLYYNFVLLVLNTRKNKSKVMFDCTRKLVEEKCKWPYSLCMEEVGSNSILYLLTQQVNWLHVIDVI